MTDDTPKRSAPRTGSPAGGARVPERGGDSSPDGGDGDGAARQSGGRWEGRRDRSFVRVDELRNGGSRPADGGADRPSGASAGRRDRFGSGAADRAAGPTGDRARPGSSGGPRSAAGDAPDRARTGSRSDARSAAPGDRGRQRRPGGGLDRGGPGRGRQDAAHPAAPAPGVPLLRAGDVVTLDVAREVSPNGYFLTDGHQDVLLHYSETTGPIKIGDPIDVFLYHDTEDRLATTMRRPKLLRGEIGLLEIVDIHSRYGVFLEMGLGRNLLLPYSELPELEELRPQVGDSVFVTLANDRQGRLVAKLAGEEELAPKCFQAPADWRSRWVEARVYKPLQIGTFVVCEGGVLGFGVIGFIPAPERSHLLRLGEKVRVRVTFIREDGRVNLSLRQQKELGRTEDADRVLDFLRARPNGAMPYSDETPADVIAAKFGISKAAFKRALGKLMRDNTVYQKGNWTYLASAESSSASDDGAPQPEA